ncbi:hypothetical protein PR202_ga26787 [Eleusine coracana subsp. coracana]|uniref:Uncharacterized protein n=1 Tax=Eleusine coracana subsp. coracana TaxID=191504 RepID=A0AAV5DFY4_ELECO|nr:hypothetical protein QOZ80_3AG0236700 [Eleusine coracana subsp. coracana]GJN08830.1 hypothetical protein PR202_ga26787 [Eleusine coracana subsp. coracana]
MRRSDWEDRCKRHPEHRLSRGVCPFCLRDRLAHLSASSSVTTTTRASTSATVSPSYSSGGGDSPPPHHVALSADVSSVHVFGGSSFVNVAAFSQPLMPTSAVNKKPTTRQELDAAAHQATKGKGEMMKKKSGRKKKIGRFLSRLVGAEKRRQAGDEGDGGELFHFKTMKEKTPSRWVFF